MSVLEDRSLHEVCKAGAITPYVPELVQPASVDLRLGNRFRVLDGHAHAGVDLANVPPDLTRRIDVGDNDAAGFLLHPGEFALGETFERITVPPDLVGRMEGKSSLGRLGLTVHVTAGFFDPGFSGRGTLEFVNLLRIPITLRPGKPICQFSFQKLVRPAEHPYQGRYQGDGGVAPSRYGRPPHEWCTLCQGFRRTELNLMEQLADVASGDGNAVQKSERTQKIDAAAKANNKAYAEHEHEVHGPDMLR